MTEQNDLHITIPELFDTLPSWKMGRISLEKEFSHIGHHHGNHSGSNLVRNVDLKIMSKTLKLVIQHLN